MPDHPPEARDARRPSGPGLARGARLTPGLLEDGRCCGAGHRAHPLSRGRAGRLRRSADDEDWSRGSRHRAFGDAADQEPFDSADASGADDEDVGIGCRSEQLLEWLPCADVDAHAPPGLGEAQPGGLELPPGRRDALPLEVGCLAGYHRVHPPGQEGRRGESDRFDDAEQPHLARRRRREPGNERQRVTRVGRAVDADQEQIGRKLLAHVEKLKVLRTEIDKGIQSLDEGMGRALDMEDFLRDKNSRHGGAKEQPAGVVQ